MSLTGKFRKTEKDTFLFAYVLSVFLGCSSVTAHWYSMPENSFIHKNEKDDRISARAVTEKAVFEVWSSSAEYPVLSGPPLFPFVSVEPPVLNDEHLVLILEIASVKEKIHFNGKIMKENVRLNLDGREDVYPNIVTVSEKNENGIYEIRESYTGIPEYIPFSGDSSVQLTYFTAVYSELKEYSFRPVLKMKSSDAYCPPLKFRPERKRTYIPYYFPFSLPVK